MSGNRYAEETTSPLGSCPSCEVDIPGSLLLIRYETADGWPEMFAECPACSDVVHPE